MTEIKPTNAFGQELKIGDVVALATTSSSSTSGRLAKIIKLIPHESKAWDRQSKSYCPVVRYNVIAKIFTKIENCVFNTRTGRIDRIGHRIKTYNRRVFRSATSLPVDPAMIPQDFKDAINAN